MSLTRRAFFASCLFACTRSPSIVALCEAGALPSALRGRVDTRGLDSAPVRARTVVVAGHSLPPMYFGRSADDVAKRVAAHAPELVVLDTCFGASVPILSSLAQACPDVFVVAAPFWVHAEGLLYGDAFFSDEHRNTRAAAVRSRGLRPLFAQTLDARSLRDVKPGPTIEAPGLARASGNILVVTR